MRYFITGASGWIGSAVTRELIGAGQQVTGLARSEASADKVSALGADVVRGDLSDLEALRTAAGAADGVVHLGFIHDFDDLMTSVQVDRTAIEALGSALEGSGRPLVVASGVAGIVPGRVATEDDQPPTGGHPRMANVAVAESFADRGVLPMFARFAPTVHGIGDHGFISVIAGIARSRGVSAYVGDGTQAWAAVHRDDAAQLVRLALASPQTSPVFHAVAETGIPTRAIAEALGERLGLPVVSLDPADAGEHFGWMGQFFGADLRASSVLTRERFGWQPTGPSLLDDIAAGGYDAPAA